MVSGRAPIFMDSLIRAKFLRIRTEVVKGCFKCRKSCSQVYSFISEGNSFSCNLSGK